MHLLLSTRFVQKIAEVKTSYELGWKVKVMKKKRKRSKTLGKYQKYRKNAKSNNSNHRSVTTLCPHLLRVSRPAALSYVERVQHRVPLNLKIRNLLFASRPMFVVASPSVGVRLSPIPW